MSIIGRILGPRWEAQDGSPSGGAGVSDDALIKVAMETHRLELALNYIEAAELSGPDGALRGLYKANEGNAGPYVKQSVSGARRARRGELAGELGRL